MLFNSYEFIFAFLPLTLFGFYLVGAASRAWALRWLILASIFFYAWWRPFNVLLIAPSILINFALARMIQRFGARGRQRAATAVLALGIAFNVVFLGYFKYTNFLATTVNDVFGANLALTHIILPLGISFITFQKIAFLIDVHAGRNTAFSFLDYCLFVLFFPQLIAGPIVHYREMMPQFHAASCRPDKWNLAVGLTLFFFGLFKKTVLADHIAAFVSPIYDHAAAGERISLLPSWMAATGFTLQIYFDFSGYTDMALGAARFFGIRLPPNFNSPLRASNIIDFWLHWHMTLTRFLTAYVYNPLVLWLTRRRLAQGRSGFGGRNATVGAFVELLMFPTVLTMALSGLWHGAGYLFVLWGLMHGVYLTINHAWRVVAARFISDKERYARIMTPAGIAITFVAVVFAMVLFRSSTVSAAVNLLSGMIGLNGMALPRTLFAHLGPLGGWLTSLGVAADSSSGHDFVTLGAWVAVLLVVALGFPNTLRVLNRYEPALGVTPRPNGPAVELPLWEWRASLAWAIGIAIVAASGLLALAGPSEFLYWQF